jgi:hypothetical protein
MVGVECSARALTSRDDQESRKAKGHSDPAGELPLQWSVAHWLLPWRGPLEWRIELSVPFRLAIRLATQKVHSITS